MKPRPEFDPDRIAFHVACVDYDRASLLVSDLLENMARMVGIEPRLETGPAELALGWTFYTLSVNKEVARRFASLPESDILQSKGATLDQKFATWLNRQLAARMQGIQVRLLSDLKSSQFGFF
ncbi:hypothetical protein [Candidatus Nitrososphaera evergladensis]|uniref:hypothetical protein n=1 Tax=Candidatus Nitrososphaera evergladensis TaxID=1459637 RepID=UPI0011E5D107|nr:hypothetical protein [Candidatus Nitrososphaera evergladensis]